MSVPAFFPLIRPGCEEVAAKYFQCVQSSALADCKKEDYEKCTVKSLKTGAKTVILTEYQKK